MTRLVLASAAFRQANRSRRGMVLVIVLVTVMFLSLAAYSFAQFMLAQYEAADLTGRQIQARQLVDSGVEAIRLFLVQDETGQRDAGGVYDNPESFRGVLVLDSPDPAARGNFTVLAPTVNDLGQFDGLRFGLEDESARLNLNALLLADEQQENGGRDLLMGLPAMTQDTADAIMDWLDDDDEVREFGAELDHYSSLDPPYQPKNGPLATVEELLLVRGVTPQLLFGADVNRNGLVDPQEQGLAIPGDPGDGSLARGWSAYLTLYSLEKNQNEAGQPRIFVNGTDMAALFAELEQAFDVNTATFIVAFRQNGSYSGSQPASGQAAGTLDLTKEGKYPITQLLDLVGKRVRVKFDGDEDSSVLESPFAPGLAMTAWLPTLMDNATVNPEPTIPGRVNINQAPRAVLLGIPGMPDDLVDKIVSARAQFDPLDDSPNHRHETWLLTDGLLVNEVGEPDLATMKTLQPFLCAGGDVRRAQVIGYFQDGTASARVEVVLDGSGGIPRVLLWRDLTRLGRGHALETLGVEVDD
ncbi:type II secretion system protein GspK [Lignipirellula cremea]|uniref:type II secretion system protein GspK n=1 Tax=Lignipirellula cremea TaxID=2528010 RepID=UPI0018D21408|nr:type II secretion system protein GspK [Lignipirellula cremea]